MSDLIGRCPIRQRCNIENEMEKSGSPKYLIVVAGGNGTRMKSSLPKQFLDLCGKAVLQRTLERFMEAVPELKVITVLPEAHIQWWKDYCISNSFICPQKIVPGGFTRFHSVRNGLSAVPDGAIVAVHDGVRPLLSADMVSRLFSVAETKPAVVPVIPCVDTMKILDRNPETGELEPVGGAVTERSRLFAVQTPQIFHSEIIRAAYCQAFDPAFTDDASVVERAGYMVNYTDGERFNIKITTTDDLTLARAILSAE